MSVIKYCSKEATDVLKILVDGLTEDLSGDVSKATRKFNNGGESIMPVTVEFLTKGTPNGDLFSVCHYYEQNGDLMRDPEVTFYRQVVCGPEGFLFYPASFRQDNLGIDEEFFQYDDKGKIITCWTRKQRDCATFCTMWMNNIKMQQKL